MVSRLSRFVRYRNGRLMLQNRSFKSAFASSQNVAVTTPPPSAVVSSVTNAPQAGFGNTVHHLLNVFAETPKSGGARQQRSRSPPSFQQQQQQRKPQPPATMASAETAASDGGESRGAAHRDKGVDFAALQWPAEVIAEETAADRTIDVSLFGLLLEKVMIGDWKSVYDITEKFCFEPRFAVDDVMLQTQLPAWIRKLVQQQQHHGGYADPLAEAVLIKPFACALCLVAYGNGLESRLLDELPNDWRDRLLGAFDAFIVAISAVADVIQQVAENKSIDSSEKRKTLIIVSLFTDRIRLCVARCRAANIRVSLSESQSNRTPLKNSYKKLFNAINHMNGNSLSAAMDTREAVIATARVIGELCPDGDMAKLQEYHDFLLDMERRWPAETETRIILNYRLGEALMAKLSFEQASQCFARALSLCPVHNSSREAILEGLCAAKLAIGECPSSAYFNHFAAPVVVEDFILAVEAASLPLFDATKNRLEAVLVSKGLLSAITTARTYVLLQMLVKYFAARATQTYEIAMVDLRAFYPGSIEEDLDLSFGFVAPMLVSGRIKGYLSSGTLKLSRKEPFPGLAMEVLMRSATIGLVDPPAVIHHGKRVP